MGPEENHPESNSGAQTKTWALQHHFQPSPSADTKNPVMDR